LGRAASHSYYNQKQGVGRSGSLRRSSCIQPGPQVQLREAQHQQGGSGIISWLTSGRFGRLGSALNVTRGKVLVSLGAGDSR
jgi:hypothetical protein